MKKSMGSVIINLDQFHDFYVDLVCSIVNELPSLPGRAKLAETIHGLMINRITKYSEEKMTPIDESAVKALRK